MLIKDLPSDLRQLVKERQIEQGNNGTFEGAISVDVLSGNFSWAASPEGFDFWKDVKNGRITSAVPIKAYITVVKKKKVSDNPSMSSNIPTPFPTQETPPPKYRPMKSAPHYNFKGQIFLVCDLDHAMILMDAANNAGWSWASGERYSHNNHHWQGYKGGQYYRITEGYRSTSAKAEEKFYWGLDVVVLSEVIEEVRACSPRYCDANKDLLEHESQATPTVTFQSDQQPINFDPKGKKLKLDLEEGGTIQLTNQFT